MDLRLFWAVAKRYKKVSITGTLLAVVLAIFAYGTPGPGGIKPRGGVTWESDAQLLITQGSGPYGRADPKSISEGNPGYMASLTTVYAGLANGSAVQNAVRATKLPGAVIATEGVDQLTGDYTPFVNIVATAPSAAGAAELAQRAIAIFQNYVAQTEAASGVPANSRVTLDVVRNGNPPVISASPKPTIPVLIFVAIFAATIMLMFSLENRDPKSAAALGRVPGEASHRDIASVAPPAYAGSTAHVDRISNGAREADDRSAALDRIIRRA
ncbi:MAG: hypothetical protein JO130_00745 [Solirubrobacterales bacterium]|nr:hypothetical protein [Solirubrobacterales bacterium]